MSEMSDCSASSPPPAKKQSLEARVPPTPNTARHNSTPAPAIGSSNGCRGQVGNAAAGIVASGSPSKAGPSNSNGSGGGGGGSGPGISLNGSGGRGLGGGPSTPNTSRVTPTPNPGPSRPAPASLASPASRPHTQNGSNPRLQHRGGSSSPEELSPFVSRSKVFSKEPFVPKEELVNQIMDMGICRNGAVKALYWTGNQSALAASNWIFDQPDRDLETPLEEELEMIRAQQAEQEREERELREEREIMARCRIAMQQQQQTNLRHHHHHHHLHHHHDHDDSLDEEDMDDEELLDDDDDEEDDEEDEEEDEEDEEDEDEDIEDDDEEMEFKMVLVVNKSLELRPGSLALFTAKATAGLFRKINCQPQASTVGPDELSMWGEVGERTVVLWADNDQHIKDLELMAKNIHLPSHMVDHKDEARKAVLGIFGEDREVNKVTGRLKVVS